MAKATVGSLPHPLILGLLIGGQHDQPGLALRLEAGLLEAHLRSITRREWSPELRLYHGIGTVSGVVNVKKQQLVEADDPVELSPTGHERASKRGLTSGIGRDMSFDDVDGPSRIGDRATNFCGHKRNPVAGTNEMLGDRVTVPLQSAIGRQVAYGHAEMHLTLQSEGFGKCRNVL